MPGVEACLQAGKWMPEIEHEAGEGPQRSRINRCSLVNERHTNKHMKQMSIDCLDILSLGECVYPGRHCREPLKVLPWTFGLFCVLKLKIPV